MTRSLLTIFLLALLESHRALAFSPNAFATRQQPSVSSTQYTKLNRLTQCPQRLTLTRWPLCGSRRDDAKGNVSDNGDKDTDDNDELSLLTRNRNDISSNNSSSNNSNSNSNNAKNDSDNDTPASLDEFLDRPLFDPDSILDETGEPLKENANPISVWFARLVRNDYELAETLYAGIFFVVLLVITQEVLRMQMYGDNYVPFVAGGAKMTGKLF